MLKALINPASKRDVGCVSSMCLDCLCLDRFLMNCFCCCVQYCCDAPKPFREEPSPLTNQELIPIPLSTWLARRETTCEAQLALILDVKLPMHPHNGRNEDDGRPQAQELLDDGVGVGQRLHHLKHPVSGRRCSWARRPWQCWSCTWRLTWRTRRARRRPHASPARPWCRGRTRTVRR